VTKIPVSLEVNGRAVDVQAEPNQPLVEVLRAGAGATDVKVGCAEGVCGTCTILLDGEPVSSCLIFAVQADGASVTTLRGLLGENGSLDPLQRSFLEHGGSQCGFCTPGMVLTAKWFADRHPDASRDEIRAALEGNLCRCTGYTKIVDAVESYLKEAQRVGPGS
jgi:aerobic-type carbon monoxide dehydrogenase small subunit (CoxS/CutS family)